jgi:hypothetical protein
MAQDTPQRAARRSRRSMRSLGWNDDAIDQAAQVGPGDADAAEASWERFAPKAARGLLSAVEEDDDAES